MKINYQRLKYILVDYFSALVSWMAFYSFRKLHVEPLKFGYEIPFEAEASFVAGLLIIPVFWLLLYFSVGYYKEVYRKSRLNEFGSTFFSVLSGVVLVFFFLILDDFVSSYRVYYQMFIFLFAVQFGLTYLLRLAVTIHTKMLILNGKIAFNVLLIGSEKKARETYNQLYERMKKAGNQIIGYITINGSNDSFSDIALAKLGGIDRIDKIIDEYNVKEVIIAIEASENKKIEEIISKLHFPGINIKAIPGMYDILTGRVKITSILDTPLIQINPSLIPVWQENLKFLLDLVIASIALILTLPLMIVIAVIIKFTSSGRVIYSHERIGRFGRPFRIYKFRSMFENAEANGPELSFPGDPRVTKFGRFLRNTKLDELPNFINVLKGELSVVGPRPERKFYIDQIMKRAPYFTHLLKVKPGITSWGQVKYGYAQNVDQMIERLKYDLIYLDNMSLFVDFKIIIYTIIILFRGRNF